jgi:hypothetical protein
MKLWKQAFAPVISSWEGQIDRWDVLLNAYKEGLEKARAAQ